MQLSLSDDLSEITVEINVWKQQAGQAVFEIGRRLKHVRDNLKYGQYNEWCENILGFSRRTANRFIQSFEQFGNGTMSSQLPVGKIFEMLSLPESIDRQKFVEEPHEIPSTGETKTVMEMTNRELREVKKALNEAEQRAAKAEATAAAEKNSAVHYEKLWKQEKARPQVIQTQRVEVIPDRVHKEMEELKFILTDLRHGYREAKDKLQKYEMQNTVDFDAEQSRKQREKLQHEADYNALELRVHINNFMEKAAITTYMTGAIAASDPITKKKLQESIDMLDDFSTKIKAALKGRILGGIVNE